MADSPHPLQREETYESVVGFEKFQSLNQENTLPDPGNCPSQSPVSDPREIAAEDDEDEEEGEEAEDGSELEVPTVSSAFDRSVADILASSEDIAMSPACERSVRKTGVKRKKGKGKGKPNHKKLQVIKEKLQALTDGLNPIPFIPPKHLDFSKHEKLLNKLGLWDFVHIDFDRNIRVDLISELVATYEPKLRASYVNGFRIMVNRADLARALRLPLRKEKGNVGVVEVDLESEVLSDDSVKFVAGIASDWLLLHEDTWIMPVYVMECMKLISDGQIEKVDWAGLFWFMVEKELKQGAHLKDCYYASHLQQLIKFQRAELFTTETMELDPKLIEEDDDQVNNGSATATEEEGHVLTGPSTELSLGQDGNEDIKDSEIMDGEICKDSDENAREGELEEEEEEDPGRWLLAGKTMTEHYLQRCNAESAVLFGSIENGEQDDGIDQDVGVEDDEEEEAMHDFGAFGSDDALEGVVFTSNLLPELEANQMALDSQDHPSMNIEACIQPSSAPFFSSSSKRVMEHVDRLPHINESNKRLRTLNAWEPTDFRMCIDSLIQSSERATAFYEEKERAVEQLNVNQQIMLAEVEKRDSIIELLHKSKQEELHKKNEEIFRLERELHFMNDVLDGYKKALKETERLFAEYKARAQLPEEPTYKDAGPGGLMLMDAEIERLRRQQEEEFRINCLIVEQKVKELEQECCSQFIGYCDKVGVLEERLVGIEAACKELIQVHGRRKALESNAGIEFAEQPEITPETKVELQTAEVESTPQQTEEEQQVAEAFCAESLMLLRD